MKEFGYLLINKPAGPTSHDVVDKLRRITGIKKIGHAGTLDPFASGLLILAIGRQATKGINGFVKLDKKYLATAVLGKKSDTHDREGEIIKSQEEGLENKITERNIKKVLLNFIGEIDQVPPMYSAKKIDGEKLYNLARKGIEIERRPVRVMIHKINLIKFDWPKLIFEAHSSSGTYIRSLAHDIGRQLGCGAYLEELKRISIGKYKLEQAIDLSKLNKDNWQKHFINDNK